MRIKRSMAFLDHFVSPEGVGCDPKKLQAVKDWPVPSNVTEIRSFLGLAPYYRHFIPNFARVASPITALTQKGVRYVWDNNCHAAERVINN